MGVKSIIEESMKIIAPEITGLDVFDQRKIDSLLISLDGTKNKSHLGANVILGVSLASARAASNCLNMPLFRYRRSKCI